MSEIKVNFNVVKTLEFLAEKLGITVNELIPYYIKWSISTGISKTSYGLFTILFSFSLFRLIINMKIFSSWSKEIAVIILILGLMIGLDSLFSAIEYLFAPKAHAVDKLISYTQR